MDYVITDLESENASSPVHGRAAPKSRKGKGATSRSKPHLK